MNTLKLKVLLFITNRHLWRSLRRALAIWLLAGLCGGVLLKLIMAHSYEPFLTKTLELAVLGLIFSTPSFVVAVPVLYFVHRFETTLERVIFSACSILFTCLSLIIFYGMIFHLPAIELVQLTAPFVCSASCAYFFIMRKPLTKHYPG